MSLRELGRTWHRLGQRDPLWAVLTHPEKSRGRWDLEEFMATGEVEVSASLNRVSALGLTPVWNTALDFGCGVGRLTQALAKRFALTHGIDIAPSMIQEAERLNTAGARCRYRVNVEETLPLGPASIDFVYSSIVLQHMEPKFAKGYLAEFLRVLKPGGIAVVQAPERMVGLPEGQMRAPFWRPGAVKAALRRKMSGEPLLTGVITDRIEMWGIPRAEVAAAIEASGGELVSVDDSTSSGDEWVAHQYFFVKK